VQREVILMGFVSFQDRYATDRDEPEVDQSQDYELLLGYENGTHTVIRFRRQYDTCDQHDYRITVSR
jgi:dimethyladenosine transferase 1